MENKTAVKLAALIGTALICLAGIVIMYGLIYSVCWCFDIAITFKVATGTVLCVIAAYLMLKSIFGGNK